MTTAAIRLVETEGTWGEECVQKLGKETRNDETARKSEGQTGKDVKHESVLKRLRTVSCEGVSSAWQ
jgi:hypothetical protein